MKLLPNKFVKVLFILVAIVTLTSGALLITLFIEANSNPIKTVLTAPHGKVIIERDNYHVPHIYALQDDKDAFYALGYVHAQDRLWQMEFQRRVASGRLSEIFGTKSLQQDKYLRTWGFYRAARETWNALDDQTKAYIHAYTEGVNSYLAKQTLPIQFYILHFKPTPWTDIDSIAWQKMMAWNLDNSWKRKITNWQIAAKMGDKAVTQFFPPYPSNSPTTLSQADITSQKELAEVSETHQEVLPIDDVALNRHEEMLSQIRQELGFDDVIEKGSNAWVVSGKLTATGKPILANDIHLQLTSPTLWYLAELKGPTLHVVGASIPGLPGIAIGHNEHIAWGITHSYADTQDLYIEDKKSAISTRKETIYIRGNPAEIFKIQESEHGPIISPITEASNVGPSIAIKWVPLQPGDTTLQSFLKLNYAKDWSQFVEALKDYVGPPENFLFADTKGNIGYYLAGKIPLRQGFNGSLPIARHDNHEWNGYIPFEKLPHSFNPPENYIATANNQITPQEYPYALTFRWHVPPFRISRIVGAITQEKVTLKNTQALQADNFSNLWLAIRAPLLSTTPLDETSKRALLVLKNWDGRFDVHSTGATVFTYWYQELLKSSTFMDGKALSFDPLFLVQSLQANKCYASYTQTIPCNYRLSNALRTATERLSEEHGLQISDWEWGNIHHANFEELAIGKIGMLGWIWNRHPATAGGDFTVNVGTYDAKTMQQTTGPVYRQIIDLSNFNNSLYVIPLGQQDNPLSLHHNDQLPLWLKGEYIGMKFS